MRAVDHILNLLTRSKYFRILYAPCLYHHRALAAKFVFDSSPFSAMLLQLLNFFYCTNPTLQAERHVQSHVGISRFQSAIGLFTLCIRVKFQ